MMRHASKTAKIAAAYRARASERPDPVCVDEWAHHLAGDEGRGLLGVGDARAPGMELGVALRTRWLDDAVSSFHGEQVVVLGAGFDTRAARLARHGRRFFEVDHPATQASKRETLKRLEDYPLDASVMIACDLEHDDFLAPLIEGGFRQDLATLVIWEGVTPYLTEDAVRGTIERVATMVDAQSKLYFDHLAPTPHDAVSHTAAQVGEPFRFLTSDIRPLVRDGGFASVRVRSMTDLRAEQTPAADDSALYGRWFLVEAERPEQSRVINREAYARPRR